MPKDFITVDPDTATSNILASELLLYIDTWRQLINRGQKLKEQFDHNSAHPDYVDIQTLYGVSDGESVYNLVTGAHAEAQADTNANNLIAQVGPG